jgi:hypothetical protein
MLPPAQLGDAIRQTGHRLGLTGGYDLGILLVHGIGEQSRGDTLTSQGDPVVKWLRGLVSKGGKIEDAKVDVLESVVRHASTDAIPGAHAVIRITPGAEDSANPDADRAHWVVAEAWWAEAFRQATFSELLGWAIFVGPFVFATEVSGIAQRMEIGEHVPTALRMVLIPITLIVGVALVLVAAAASFLVSAIAIALVLVAVTQIPFFADLARSLQQNLASGFGDAYVLTRSPVRFAAMAAQVHAGLQALRRECSSVVVIAESMGTAVAWYGLQLELTEPQNPNLKEREPAPVGLWLTHGQALRKLTFALRMARGDLTARHTILAAVTTISLGLSLFAFVIDLPWWFVVAPLVLAGIAQIRLMAIAMDVWNRAGEGIAKDWEKVRQSSPDLDWLDLWASADPFALGPLDVKGEKIKSYKIRNTGSPWADHTSYWKNTTEFLPIVAAYLFSLGGPKTYASGLDDPRLEVPAMRRHARVLALLPLRFVIVVGLVTGLLFAWLNPDMGATLITFVGSLNLPFIDGFFDDPPEWATALAGYLAVAVLGVIAWGVISALWNGLMGGDEKTYFGRVGAPLWTLPWYLFVALVVPVAAAIALAFVVGEEPRLAAGFALASGFLTTLGLAVLSGGGTVYAGGEEAHRTREAISQITARRSTTSGEIAKRTREANSQTTAQRAASIGITLLIAMVLVAIPLVTWFWFRESFPLIISMEIVALSLVLAIEAIREYRIFSTRFHELNAKLPQE